MNGLRVCTCAPVPAQGVTARVSLFTPPASPEAAGDVGCISVLLVSFELPPLPPPTPGGALTQEFSSQRNQQWLAFTEGFPGTGLFPVFLPRSVHTAPPTKSVFLTSLLNTSGGHPSWHGPGECAELTVPLCGDKPVWEAGSGPVWGPESRAVPPPPPPPAVSEARLTRRSPRHPHLGL